MSAATGDSGVNVLVVDDHDVVHWGFKLLLSKQSWVESCASASSATEAICTCVATVWTSPSST